MSLNNPTVIVQTALKAILCDPIYDESKISLYFSETYQQHVDGKKLNYVQFIKHLRFLKEQTKQIQLSFLSVVANDDTVFTHHYVKAKKINDSLSEFEVLARFTISSGKIISCHELTRMIKGNDEDVDLGSKK